ncbi:hypothetical protein BLA29_009181 [Euroglyphus maynei]|uniref:Uncharacterized protein n=1 Tax=Euroglyphus maynei TaxID=6958 RepID=A0A1Y3BNS9_EURMA|nr:hypothetical protein BLA29_009181 [Euroglyphus maynei]
MLITRWQSSRIGNYFHPKVIILKMFFNVGLSVPLASVNTAYMTMCSCYGYPLQHRCCRRCYQMNLAVVSPVAVVPAIIPTASISVVSHTSRICTPVVAQRPCSYRRSSVCSKRR